MARATISSLNAHRSSIDPPPRPTMIASSLPPAAPSPSAPGPAPIAPKASIPATIWAAAPSPWTRAG
jgi:hypothetical protein